ncbi:hypothetical protein NEOLEDRAFT_1182697 [Neolentinus lepideus HHB14362 ss-1]|uniref:CBM1 domain-containing protein n=1 Tax=Neolentinus lepideus HHB14362 ss-1 TaxID=1314782 RepID=A0A165NYI2_9AGAM|nr:hypothetical protein NEOLEDRAFT_1182697 [Neolentinus lepideus HHB14362 ss-1]
MYFSRIVTAIVAVAVLAVGANAQCCMDAAGQYECAGDGTGTCCLPYHSYCQP